MNLCLLDPFQSDFPEVIEEYLEHGSTKCIAFNRRGTLLAAGCLDGSCVIWDFDTRGVAKELRDPNCSSASVTSVSWSKCGRRLLAAFTDKTLALWDVYEGVKTYSITLHQTVLNCRLDPGRSLPTLCLACPLSGCPVLVDFVSGELHNLPVHAHGGEGASNGRGKHNDSNPVYSQAAASFNKRGNLIYVGNSKGEILIIDTQSRQIKVVVPVPGGAAIRHIVFSRNGQYLLTNSNDRIIRVFENLLPREGAALADSAVDGRRIPAANCLRLTKDFQDAVNRMHWKAACFNGDGECVVGASANKGEHKIHIWNRNFGQLARILEGPKEGLCDLAWHPTRPVVASVSMSGAVYLWAKDYTENWSAFAPDFKELEENEEYVEREDEFDIIPEADKIKPAQLEDDVEVDVETVEKVAAFSDSDDSQDGLYFLPTIPLPDEVPDSPSHEHPPTPAKPSSSSATETDAGSPVSDRGRNPRQMELNPTQSVDSHPEDEIGPNGRIKRKRKLSEKAAELQAEKQQAEKGRKTAPPTKAKVPAPKSKGDKQPALPKSSPVESYLAEREDWQNEKSFAPQPPAPKVSLSPKVKLVPKTKPAKPKAPVKRDQDTKKDQEAEVYQKAREDKEIRRQQIVKRSLEEAAGYADDEQTGQPRVKKNPKPKRSKPVAALSKPIPGFEPNTDAHEEYTD
ncbi:hypothetical protein R1flu_009739 [Riccia fluitans]|uniref:Uncharacterized protein n=1 Tax=Riccia fluitans TaxID=41844 RepID=A0ABD1Z757_9MARC